MGNFVPAFEILFEDFCCVGWFFFFLWVSIVTLHPATVFWRAAFPVLLVGLLVGFFFPNPFSLLLP